MKVLALSALVLGIVAGAPAVAQPPPIDALPQILQLQLSQHPAWRQYKDAAAVERAEGAHQADQAEELNAMSTPQRLDALLDQMKKQQADFERQANATKAFYAVLSPDQRAIFDQVTRLPVQPRPPAGYRPRPQRPDPNTSTLRVPPYGTLPPPVSSPTPQTPQTP